MKSKLAIGLGVAILGGAIAAVLRSRTGPAESRSVATVRSGEFSPPTPSSDSAISNDQTHEGRAVVTNELSTEEKSKSSAADSDADSRHTSNRYGKFPFSLEQSQMWQAKYEGKTLAELDAARDSIEKAIAEFSHPILKEMLTSGKGTLIPPEDRKPITAKDSEIVSMLYYKPKGEGGGIYRASLSPEEYPDLYALRYESIWLNYAINGRFRPPAPGVIPGK
jgi:hypothetical protein